MSRAIYCQDEREEDEGGLEQYVDTLLVELTGYASNQDYKVMCELLLAFSKKFK